MNVPPSDWPAGFAVNELRLIGDIGGTNARFAIAQGGKYDQLRHVEVDQYPSLLDALSDYLRALPPAERAHLAGLLDVAGPVLGDRITMTNKAWSFSVGELKQGLGLASLTVVNDFAATARAIPYLPHKDLLTVGPQLPGAKGNIAVIGPGTGLGMSALIPNGGEWVLVAGEGDTPRSPPLRRRNSRSSRCCANVGATFRRSAF